MYVWVIFDGCICAKLHDQYHSVSQLCHSSAHLSPPKIYGTPQVRERNMITILWGHVTPESHNYTSRCGNIMRLIFARTARRPIAHALHPIHIGGYFLHCNILYDYLLNSYNWNVVENVDFCLCGNFTLWGVCLKWSRPGFIFFWGAYPSQFIQDMPGSLLFQLGLSQNFGAFLAAGIDSFYGAVG